MSLRLSEPTSAGLPQVEAISRIVLDPAVREPHRVTFRLNRTLSPPVPPGALTAIGPAMPGSGSASLIQGSGRRAHEQHWDRAGPGGGLGDVAEPGMEHATIAVAADDQQVEAMSDGIVTQRDGYLARLHRVQVHPRGSGARAGCPGRLERSRDPQCLAGGLGWPVMYCLAVRRRRQHG